jgi:hypothetical protein
VTAVFLLYKRIKIWQYIGSDRMTGSGHPVRKI